MREQTRFFWAPKRHKYFVRARKVPEGFVEAIHNSKMSQELEALNSERASGRGENINQVGP